MLGASLIEAIRSRVPELSVEGIGGPEMQQAGCRSLYPIQLLSVMGLVEVLGRYFKITAARRALVSHFLETPPDIFIGIDAPDFNLGLERQLRLHGIKTAHYVSPQVWAWREYRLKKIREAVDLMLTLYPFEEDYYRQKGMSAVCVGHPLADRIPMQPDQPAARARLGLPRDKRVLAIMPGSRKMEIENLLSPFLLAADRCRKQCKDIHIVSSLLHDEAIAAMRDAIRKLGLEELPISIYKGKSHDVLEAADVVLLASGTIALETMLYKKPMVVLANEEVVPECLQAQCTPARLAAEIRKWLDDQTAITSLQQRFSQLHQDLKQNGAEAACEHVMKLVLKP